MTDLVAGSGLGGAPKAGFTFSDLRSMILRGDLALAFGVLIILVVLIMPLPAIVLDLFARKVVGWSMAPSMPAELVCNALNMAIGQRQPGPGLVVHSDRGSQYASALYQELLDEHGFVCSMSRKGNCWDNAVAERFFLNLKMERVWQRQYANHAEAKADITDYIVGFYNCKRINSALGNLSPAVYERKMAEHEPIVVSEIT